MNTNNERRVVVTGIGAVTPIGLNFTDFWGNALKGKSGVRPITLFDTSQYDVRFAGEITEYDPINYMNKKVARRMDRFIQFAYTASQEALADSGLDLDKCDRDEVGAIIGSGIGGLRFIEDQKQVILEKGPSKVYPFLVPMVTIDMAAGQISILMGLRGPNFAVTSACATGTNAIGVAYRHIKSGDADVIFSGGTEAAITPISLSGFAVARALSTRNDDPKTASRPFDANRDGFVIAEGAAILILEELSHARKRGSKIYAEILSFAATADGHHMTAPHPEGEGAARAMTRALTKSGLNYDEIDYINAHATSTHLGDLAEINAVKTVFKEYAPKLTLSATKSLVGHLLGGAGALGVACAAKSVETGLIHPSINISEKDPLCDLDLCESGMKKREVRNALCNAFGFGGHNTAIILGKIKD